MTIRIHSALVVAALAFSQAVDLRAAEPVYRVGYAAGRTTLNGGNLAAASVPLHGGYYANNIASTKANSRTNLSEAIAHVTHANTPQISRKSLILKSTAVAHGSFTSGNAQLNTTGSHNGGPGWVDVYIGPGSRRDPSGKKVTVTLSVDYTSYISGSGQNFVALAYTDGRSSYTLLNQPVNGNGSYRNTRTFQSTVGSTFRIYMVANAKAGRESKATGTLNLTIATE